MAEKLWLYLKHHVYPSSEEEQQRVTRYVRHYCFRKPWRVWSRKVVRHILEAKADNRFVKYSNGYWFHGGDFYGDRKPWKRLSNYTLARVRHEWGSG